MLLFRYFTCSVQLKFISCITLQKFSSVFFYIKHFLGPNDQSPKDDTLVGQVLGCGLPLCNEIAGPQSSSFQIVQIGLFSSALWLKNWSTKPQESHFRLGRLVGALCASKYTIPNYRTYEILCISRYRTAPTWPIWMLRNTYFCTDTEQFCGINL